MWLLVVCDLWFLCGFMIYVYFFCDYGDLYNFRGFNEFVMFVILVMFMIFVVFDVLDFCGFCCFYFMILQIRTQHDTSTDNSKQHETTKHHTEKHQRVKNWRADWNYCSPGCINFKFLNVSFKKSTGKPKTSKQKPCRWNFGARQSARGKVKIRVWPRVGGREGS